MHNHDPFTFCPKCASRLELRLQMGEERPTCPNCGWVQYEDPKVAAGVLLLHENRVLLVRRTMDPYIGSWSIPAGFVNAYELPETAAIRETREETGLDVTIDRLFTVLSGREHPRGADILLVYLATQEGGQLAAADDADQAEWFKLDALPPLAFETTRKVLEQVRAMNS